MNALIKLPTLSTIYQRFSSTEPHATIPIPSALNTLANQFGMIDHETELPPVTEIEGLRQAQTAVGSLARKVRLLILSSDSSLISELQAYSAALASHLKQHQASGDLQNTVGKLKRMLEQASPWMEIQRKVIELDDAHSAALFQITDCQFGALHGISPSSLEGLGDSIKQLDSIIEKLESTLLSQGPFQELASADLEAALRTSTGVWLEWLQDLADHAAESSKSISKQWSESPTKSVSRQAKRVLQFHADAEDAFQVLQDRLMDYKATIETWKLPEQLSQACGHIEQQLSTTRQALEQSAKLVALVTLDEAPFQADDAQDAQIMGQYSKQAKPSNWVSNSLSYLWDASRWPVRVKEVAFCALSAMQLSADAIRGYQALSNVPPSSALIIPPKTNLTSMEQKSLERDRAALGTLLSDHWAGLCAGTHTKGMEQSNIGSFISYAIDCFQGKARLSPEQQEYLLDQFTEHQQQEYLQSRDLPLRFTRDPWARAKDTPSKGEWSVKPLQGSVKGGTGLITTATLTTSTPTIVLASVEDLDFDTMQAFFSEKSSPHAPAIANFLKSEAIFHDREARVIELIRKTAASTHSPLSETLADALVVIQKHSSNPQLVTDLVAELEVAGHPIGHFFTSMTQPTPKVLATQEPLAAPAPEPGHLSRFGETATAEFRSKAEAFVTITRAGTDENLPDLLKEALKGASANIDTHEIVAALVAGLMADIETEWIIDVGLNLLETDHPAGLGFARLMTEIGYSDPRLDSFILDAAFAEAPRGAQALQLLLAMQVHSHKHLNNRHAPSRGLDTIETIVLGGNSNLQPLVQALITTDRGELNPLLNPYLDPELDLNQSLEQPLILALTWELASRSSRADTPISKSRAKLFNNVTSKMVDTLEPLMGNELASRINGMGGVFSLFFIAWYLYKNDIELPENGNTRLMLQISRSVHHQPLLNLVEDQLTLLKRMTSPTDYRALLKMQEGLNAWRNR